MLISFALTILCLVLAIVLDEDMETAVGPIFAVSAAVFLIAAIIAPFIGNFRDKKIYGKGRLTITYNGGLTPQQRTEATNFLFGFGFLLNGQGNAAYFTRTINGFVGQHIGISDLNGTISLEAFCTSTQFWSIGKESGLYGLNAILMKYNLRKILAQLLDILNAPQDITI